MRKKVKNMSDNIAKTLIATDSDDVKLDKTIKKYCLTSQY